LRHFNTVYLLIFTLLFSFASSFLVLTLVHENTPPEEPAQPPYTHLFNNYRTMVHFLRLPVNSEMVLEDGMDTGIPLLDDLSALEKATLLLNEKNYAQLEASLDKLDSKYKLVTQKKKDLYTRYLYFKQDYKGFIQQLEKEPNQRLELNLLLLNSYVKTGAKQKSFALFKRLFRKNKLKHFQSHLSRKTLNDFLKRLDYDYWFKKFKYLASSGQFTEFIREKIYIRSPQLINLITAEFHYQRKQYDRCKRLLAKVNDEKLHSYKKRMVLKMEVRDLFYDNIPTVLQEVKEEPDIYLELLLDCASLLLIDGEADKALALFTRYVKDVKQYRFTSALLINRPLPPVDSSYWKALWRCAWLNIRNKRKKEAITFFKDGIDASMDSFKIANRYWLRRLAPEQAEKLGVRMADFPFSYYYSLEHPESPQVSDSLEPFINRLNHPRSGRMSSVLKDLEVLVRFNLFAEARALIQWNINNEILSTGDVHTLMLLESITYLKQGNSAMAFISYRDNFDCYRCLRLPRFLQKIALPVKYSYLIDKYCDQHNLDPSLVYSLIREESYFRSGAVSYANAYGLMQLLLKTAKQVAYSQGMKVFKRDLFKPEINIRYGTAYLKFLLDKYQGKLHLALAAYNAGDHRVDKWLTRFGDAPQDQFIEMIPFSATRSYVKNILRNYYYYRFYNDQYDE
jgi:soluble lytic murein transglycosylase-like protein